MSLSTEALAARDRGALFLISHSGGKDSQAMYLALRDHIPVAQIMLVHADLGRVEWTVVKEHIAETTDGLPLHVAYTYDRNGERKDLLDSVRDRAQYLAQKRTDLLARNPVDLTDHERKFLAKELPSPWPDSSARWCTSDFKVGPIMREARRYADANGFTEIVNCMGIRAQESPARAKKVAWEQNKKESNRRRTVWNYLPILDLTEAEVFSTISSAGQEPHAMYAAGMSRLSCCFCVLANKSDLRTAATLAPELYSTYVDLEKELGRTIKREKGANVSLEQYTGIKAKVA